MQDKTRLRMILDATVVQIATLVELDKRETDEEGIPIPMLKCRTDMVAMHSLFLITLKDIVAMTLIDVDATQQLTYMVEEIYAHYSEGITANKVGTLIDPSRREQWMSEVYSNTAARNAKLWELHNDTQHAVGSLLEKLEHPSKYVNALPEAERMQEEVTGRVKRYYAHKDDVRKVHTSGRLSTEVKTLRDNFLEEIRTWDYVNVVPENLDSCVIDVEHPLLDARKVRITSELGEGLFVFTQKGDEVGDIVYSYGRDKPCTTVTKQEHKECVRLFHATILLTR